MALAPEGAGPLPRRSRGPAQREEVHCECNAPTTGGRGPDSVLKLWQVDSGDLTGHGVAVQRVVGVLGHGLRLQA